MLKYYMSLMRGAAILTVLDVYCYKGDRLIIFVLWGVYTKFTFMK